MKWLRICALLVAFISAMRVVSWAIAWILVKLAPGRHRFAVLAANVIVFGLFTSYLLIDLAPGEPVDIAALLFGLAVCALCCWTDFFWTPWKRKR